MFLILKSKTLNCQFWSLNFGFSRIILHYNSKKSKFFFHFMRYAENISAKLLIFAIKIRQQFICTKKKKTLEPQFVCILLSKVMAEI